MTTQAFVGRYRASMRSTIPDPGDEYLRSVGEVAYLVASLEWLVLGELSGRLAARVPPTLDLVALAGATTGRIVTTIRKALPSVTDAAVVAFLAKSADELEAASKLRNALLHARPATIEDKQRLYRWSPNHGETFPISDSWLDGAIDSIASGLLVVDRLRSAL